MNIIEQNEYCKYIYKSRYARWQDDLGRRENWEESVTRLCDFWKEKSEFFPYKLIYDAIYEGQTMPSMRSLMTAGKALERDNVAGFNCAFVAIDDPKAFDEILYILACFHPKTQIKTLDGDKAIGEISLGDMVLSFNESHNKYEWKEVEATTKTKTEQRKKLRITLDNGKQFDCTEDHEWLTSNRGWVQAKDLTVEDDLVAPKFEVYKCTNKLTNKSYVGYTGKGSQARFKQHCASAKNKNARDYDTHFHKSIRKHGESEWIVEVIGFANTEKEAQQIEVQSIALYDTKLNGYNCTDGGEGSCGTVWTEESRRKASENAYERTDAHRENSRQVLLALQPKIVATRQTPEYKEAQRLRNLGENNPAYGKKHSPERLAQIKEQVSGTNNPFYGKTHSEETKNLISEKQKLRASQTKNHFKGKKHSDETKAKMKAHWAKRREEKAGKN